MFIKKLAGGYFFSGQVVGIQSNLKEKCTFDENGYIHNYTHNQLQAYYTNQTALYNVSAKEGSIDNGSDDNDEGNGGNDNDAN